MKKHYLCFSAIFCVKKVIIEVKSSSVRHYFTIRHHKLSCHWMTRRTNFINPSWTTRQVQNKRLLPFCYSALEYMNSQQQLVPVIGKSVVVLLHQDPAQREQRKPITKPRTAIHTLSEK